MKVERRGWLTLLLEATNLSGVESVQVRKIPYKSCPEVVLGIDLGDKPERNELEEPYESRGSRTVL